jgi:hypothetical protein
MRRGRGNPWGQMVFDPMMQLTWPHRPASADRKRDPVGVARCDVAIRVVRRVL